MYRLYAVAAPALVGLLWWRRRPIVAHRHAALRPGDLAAVMAWQASPYPIRFSFGVLAEAPYTAVFCCLCLSFPTGRLEGAVRKHCGFAADHAAAHFCALGRLRISRSMATIPRSTADPTARPTSLQLTTLPEALRGGLGTAATVLVSIIGLGVVALHVSRIRTGHRGPADGRMTGARADVDARLPSDCILRCRHAAYSAPPERSGWASHWRWPPPSSPFPLASPCRCPVGAGGWQ